MTGHKVRCRITANTTCAVINTATSNELTFTVNAVTAINPVPAINYGIKCYPNPTAGMLIIDSLRASDKWQSIHIISMDAKQDLIIKSLNNQSRITIDVSKLPGGTYAIIFKGNNNKRTYLRFVKL